MSTQLSQIAKKAKLDRKARFTSLAHLLTPEFLKETWGKMNRRAAGGVDGQSAEQFGQLGFLAVDEKNVVQNDGPAFVAGMQHEAPRAESSGWSS